MPEFFTIDETNVHTVYGQVVMAARALGMDPPLPGDAIAESRQGFRDLSDDPRVAILHAVWRVLHDDGIHLGLPQESGSYKQLVSGLAYLVWQGYEWGEWHTANQNLLPFSEDDDDRREERERNWYILWALNHAEHPWHERLLDLYEEYRKSDVHEEDEKRLAERDRVVGFLLALGTRPRN